MSSRAERSVGRQGAQDFRHRFEFRHGICPVDQGVASGAGLGDRVTLAGRSGVGVLEQFSDRDAQHTGHTGEHAGAQAVGAGLVLLQLLMADPEFLAQLGQGEILSCPQLADLLTDQLVNARWGTLTGNPGVVGHSFTS